jgi:hypothetical protein
MSIRIALPLTSQSAYELPVMACHGAQCVPCVPAAGVPATELASPAAPDRTVQPAPILTQGTGSMDYNCTEKTNQGSQTGNAGAPHRSSFLRLKAVAPIRLISPYLSLA